MMDKYFSYEEIDSLYDLIVSFFYCTLKVDIGPYKAGQKVCSIDLDLEEMEISIYESEASEDPTWSGTFDLVFGNNTNNP